MRLNPQGVPALDFQGAAVAVWLTDDTQLFQQPIADPDGAWQLATNPAGTAGRGTPYGPAGGASALAANLDGGWMRALDGANPRLTGSRDWQPADGWVGDMAGSRVVTFDQERTTAQVYDTPDADPWVWTRPATTLAPFRLSPCGRYGVWVDRIYGIQVYDFDLRQPVTVQTVAGAPAFPLVYAYGDTLWLAYQTDAQGGIIHTSTDPTQGYRYGPRPITNPMDGIYEPDWVPRGAGIILGWAADPGQFTLRSQYIFALGDGMVPLQATPVPPPPTPTPIPPPETPMTPNHSAIIQAVWAEGGFKLTTDEGCGLFTEACVRALHAHDPRWGHLLKHDGQRQFRGHAVDAALYRHDNPGQSVAADLITNSKTPALAAPGWGLDIPRYSSSGWAAPEPVPVSHISRPSMPLLVCATCFDLGVSRDFGLVDELKAAGINTLRIVVASKFRTERSLETGRLQLRSLLPKLIERGMKASIVVNCDTAEYGLREIETREHTAFVNAILREYPAAVALVELFNENSHGVEQVYATDPYFLRDLDALIDPQFPVAWGANHGGEAISDRLAGGSIICAHSDRSLLPGSNATIMAAAQRRFGKPVVDMEPLGMGEVPRAGARTDDPRYIQSQAVVDKEAKLGGSCYHFEAGLPASSATPPYGPKQREALKLFGAVFAGTTPQPPTPVPPPSGGDKVLDAPLTPAYPTGYTFFVNHYEQIADEAEAWYYRAFKRHPAPSDIAHGLWRALNEGERWGTLRNALEETWPGGGR
jgi:hypothetical protein